MSIVSSSTILTFLSYHNFFCLTSPSCLHMRGATTSEQTNESLPFISMDLFYKKRGNRTTGRRQGDVTRRFTPPQQTNKPTNKNRRQRSVCGFDHEGSARKKQSCGMNQSERSRSFPVYRCPINALKFRSKNGISGVSVS